MDKAESAVLPGVPEPGAKSGRVKRRKKTSKPKVNLAFDQAGISKMIDQIRQEIEFHHGCASELRAKLEKLTGTAMSDSKEHPAGRPETNGVKKILVVDDDVTTVKIISHFLEKDNYRVIASLSGLDGLKKAFQEPPDLILLDVMMPDLNGFQFLSIYRKDKENARIPVIILSYLSEEADVLKGLETGAMDYITKPFSPQVLMAKIKKNLNSGP